jgi:hypothetical protein
MAILVQALEKRKQTVYQHRPLPECRNSCRELTCSCRDFTFFDISISGLFITML